MKNGGPDQFPVITYSQNLNNIPHQSRDIDDQVSTTSSILSKFQTRIHKFKDLNKADDSPRVPLESVDELAIPAELNDIHLAKNNKLDFIKSTLGSNCLVGEANKIERDWVMDGSKKLMRLQKK